MFLIAVFMTCAAGVAQEAKQALTCGDCHDESFTVLDIWTVDGDEAEPLGCGDKDDENEAALTALRRSLSTVNDGIQRLTMIVHNMEEAGVEVEALEEPLTAAVEKFGELKNAEMVTDLDTLAANGKISLSLQKLYGNTERIRQERKSRTIFAVTLLATLLVFGAILSGLKTYLPEAVDAADLEEPGAEDDEADDGEDGPAEGE